MDPAAAIAIIGAAQLVVTTGVYVRMGRLIERQKETERRLSRLEFERG